MLRKSLLTPLLLAVTGSAALLAMGTAAADTLLLDGVEQAARSNLDRPARGESKARVEERFGQPNRTVAAVGEPPISRWEYPGFIVYFEHDHVIHAVPRRESRPAS